MKSPFGLLLLVAVTVVLAQSPLKVVENLDLNRYAGKWYEAARFPNRFQDKCTGEVTADYTLQADGNIRSEEHTSELQSQSNLVCRLLLEKKKKKIRQKYYIIKIKYIRIS